MMTTARHQWGQPVDVAAEPIEEDLKACILKNLWAHPGSRVVERNGVLFFHNGRFEFRCDHLCAAKPPTRT